MTLFRYIAFIVAHVTLFAVTAPLGLWPIVIGTVLACMAFRIGQVQGREEGFFDGIKFQQQVKVVYEDSEYLPITTESINDNLVPGST